MTTTTLQSVDDVLALALDCGNDLNLISNNLVPSLERLCRSTEGQEVLLQAAQGGRDPLTLLDPAIHSTAFLWILVLRAYVAESATDYPTITPFIDSFCANFDAKQIIREGEKATSLARSIMDIASKNGYSQVSACRSLVELFLRFTNGIPNYLTTLHPIVLQYLYRSGESSSAHSIVLARGVNLLDKQITPLKSLDVIDYYFWSGAVAFDAGDWSRAEDAYETCVTAPAQSAHERQILASKRLILVQLIRHGKTNPLPHYTSPTVQRAIRRPTQPYVEFADQYASSSRSVSERDLESILRKYQENFETDRTLPILQNLISGFSRRRVQRLGETFEKLRLADIVTLLDLKGQDESREQAEVRLRADVEQMIASRNLAATLTDSSPSPILTFHTETLDSASYTTLESIGRISRQTEDLAAWSNHLEAEERRLTISRTFVQKQQQGGLMAPGGLGSYGRGGGVMRDRADQIGLVGIGAGGSDDFEESVFDR